MASVSNNPPPAAAEDQPSTEDRWAVIERVAASEQFSRSARLRDFLLYVGKQSLKEGCPEIHEQEIGAKVFGRPVSYDRSQDNIVRVNATELRRRIESYFATAGAHEPLIFEIPRGGYKPVFRRRLPEAAESLPPQPTPLPQVDAPVRAELAAHIRSPLSLWIGRFAWPVTAAALAVACALLIQQNRTLQRALHPWENQPAVAAFWNGFLDAHRQTDIVLPDDSASVIEDIARSPTSLDDYLNREYFRRTQESDMSADRKEDVYQIFNHNLVTFGGVRAAQLVLGEIPTNYPRYLTMTRYFTADEINRDNVVLVGGKKSVPWDHLFDDESNFVTDYDDAQGVGFIRNRDPKPGEQAAYAPPSAPNSLIGYAVIAYLPNPGHTGNAIILAGTDSDATGAAAAFLTSEDQMKRLRSTLHADRFPYFEAVLKTSRMSGTFFDSELIAYRAYPQLH
jgi:hypothetical protein